MAINLKVFGARAVVKLDKAEDKTIGGIILSEKNKEPVTTGTVVVVGTGTRLDNGSKFPMEIQVGDRIIYSPMAGAPVKSSDGEDYLVINEKDVLAIIGYDSTIKTDLAQQLISNLQDQLTQGSFSKEIVDTIEGTIMTLKQHFTDGGE